MLKDNIHFNIPLSASERRYAVASHVKIRYVRVANSVHDGLVEIEGLKGNADSVAAGGIRIPWQVMDELCSTYIATREGAPTQSAFNGIPGTISACPRCGGTVSLCLAIEGFRRKINCRVCGLVYWIRYTLQEIVEVDLKELSDDDKHHP